MSQSESKIKSKRKSKSGSEIDDLAEKILTTRPEPIDPKEDEEEMRLQKMKTKAHSNRDKQVQELKEKYPTEESLVDEMRRLVEAKKYKPGTQTNHRGSMPPSVLDIDESDDKAKNRARVMTDLMKWYTLPKAEDDDEIERRIELFFEVCAMNGEYPTVEKLNLAIGYGSSTIRDWMSGMILVSDRRREIIKKAYDMIHATEAELASTFQIQPVVYMFRSKNHFGMSDKQEVQHVVTDPLGAKVNNKELEDFIGSSVVIDAEFTEK